MTAGGRRYRFFRHLATDHGSVRRAFPTRRRWRASRRRSPTASSAIAGRCASPSSRRCRWRACCAAAVAARARARGLRAAARLGHRGQLRRARLPAARRSRRRDRRRSRHPCPRRRGRVGGGLPEDGGGVSRGTFRRRRRDRDRARSTRCSRGISRATDSRRSQRAAGHRRSCSDRVASRRRGRTGFGDRAGPASVALRGIVPA